MARLALCIRCSASIFATDWRTDSVIRRVGCMGHRSGLTTATWSGHAALSSSSSSRDDVIVFVRESRPTERGCYTGDVSHNVVMSYDLPPGYVCFSVSASSPVSSVTAVIDVVIFIISLWSSTLRSRDTTSRSPLPLPPSLRRHKVRYVLYNCGHKLYICSGRAAWLNARAGSAGEQ